MKRKRFFAVLLAPFLALFVKPVKTLTVTGVDQYDNPVVECMEMPFRFSKSEKLEALNNAQLRLAQMMDLMI